MADAVVRFTDATLKRGGRTLWSNINAAIKAGEFVAVLGPNGAGKTSLLKVLLGLVSLTNGEAYINGKQPERGNRHIGYIPQQKNFDPMLPVRGRDLVALGISGHRFGVSRVQNTAALVDGAIESVGASVYASMPIGLLSGGEQQRLRIAQALVGQPRIVLCDEPLLSLDLASQQTITTLLDNYRKSTGAAIIFVTHEINPVLPYVDKVLYIANGHWVIDTPERVLQSKMLSKLYGTSIEVLRIKGRVLVVGAEDAALASPGAHHEEAHV